MPLKTVLLHFACLGQFVDARISVMVRPVDMGNEVQSPCFDLKFLLNVPCLFLMRFAVLIF